MRTAYKSNLLVTSVKDDFRVSGGKLYVTGLDAIKVADILDIQFKRSRAEVRQLWTIGTTTPTIVAGTKYSIQIIAPVKDQGSEDRVRVYSTTAPSVLSGNAATDRSNIYVALAAQINADAGNYVAATANVGGSGVSMTIQDDPGYFAARPSSRRGASQLKLVSGFINATHLVQTTAPVYSLGIGTRMVQDLPVQDPITGNLITGEYDGQAGAVAGQLYDLVVLTFNVDINHKAVSGLTGGKSVTQFIWVDNGTGSSVTNLAGYNAFMKRVRRVLYGRYQNDPSAIVEFFDNYPTFAGSATAAPTGATGDKNVVNTGKNSFHYVMLGAGQTLLVPVWSTAGLKLDLDAADDEGIELSAPVEADSPKEFVVGKTEFSIKGRMSFADVSDTDTFNFGFRKKEAYQAAVNDYDEMASLGMDAETATADLKILTIKNAAATVSTDTTVNWADGETHELEIRVALDGTVKFIVDGVDRTSVQATAFSFDAAEVVIPFIYLLNGTASPPDFRISELHVIPAIIEDLK